MKPLFALAALAVLAACAVPDDSRKPGADIHPHRNVDRLGPEYAAGTSGFTGVIVYGDKGYTGLVGDINYPSIKVNGRSIGKCEKRRAKLVPLAPGSHVVTAHSENTVTRPITLGKGQIAWFRCSFMRIGGVIYPPAVLASADGATATQVVNGG